jgi:hypothetical protein
MRSRLTLIVVLLIFCVVSMAFGADIYVSPPLTGNDAAAGTITAPLATLTAARDKAGQLKANNTPVTVYLRGGTMGRATPGDATEIWSGNTYLWQFSRDNQQCARQNTQGFQRKRPFGL